MSNINVLLLWEPLTTEKTAKIILNSQKVNKLEKGENYFRPLLPVFDWKTDINIIKWELSKLGFNNIEYILCVDTNILKDKFDFKTAQFALFGCRALLN